MLLALEKNIDFLSEHIRLPIPMPMKSEKHLGHKMGTRRQKLGRFFIPFCIFSERKGETLVSEVESFTYR